MASRVRCTNFSLEEIEILVGLVHQYKKVLECKSTDAVSNKEKEKAWEKLAMEFNSISSCGRSLKMLRNKWDSLKKATRKEYATLKNSLYKTGGGPSTDHNLGPIGTRVLEVIGLSVTGTSCPYDGDYVDITKTFETEEEGNKTTEMELDLQEFDWSRWNPSVLREPKNKKLCVSQEESIELSKSPIDLSIVGVGEIANGRNTPTSANDVAGPSSVTIKADKFEGQSPSLERKRPFLLGTKGAKKHSVQKDGHATLLLKKTALLDLQIRLLQEEHDLKEKRLQEKHDLEMKILQMDLQLKERQIKHS